MYFLSFVLVLSGTGLLCLSMQKHFRVFWKLTDANSKLRVGLRAAGYGLLIIALYVGSLEDSFGIALTTLCGVFTLTHIIVALYMSRKEVARH